MIQIDNTICPSCGHKEAERHDDGITTSIACEKCGHIVEWSNASISIKLEPVTGSSQIEAMAYGEGDKALIIKFKSSAYAYLYKGVPIEVYEEIYGSPSMGAAVHKLVKGKYDYATVPIEKSGETMFIVYTPETEKGE